MEKTEERHIRVLTLLKKFKGWVEAEDPEQGVQFLSEKGPRGEVVQLVEKLIKRFEDAEEELKTAEGEDKKQGRKKHRVLSDHLDWNETHKEGRDLWRKLASYALIDIEETSKGNAKLFEFVEAATRFEDVLYGLEEFYRDHTLHSLWVYLIGEYLLREKLPNIRQDLNWYLFNDIETDAEEYGYCRELVDKSREQETGFCDNANERRDATWCIIALCHDLGYSLEKLKKLNEKVLDVLKFFDVSDFKDVGYFLNIEHQYLVSQFLELMAMDVRIVPSEDYWELDELKETLNRQIRNLDERLRDPEDPLDKKKYEEEKEELENCLEKKLKEKVLVKCYRDDATYWQLCRAMERKEHGILSAYLIFKVLGIFADTSVRGAAEEWGLDDDEVAENVIRGDILFAIAQHQFEFAHLAQLASLGDVLVLADELEEFSRLGRQLQSRKYCDTAANAEVNFDAVEGGEIAPDKVKKEKWTEGSEIDVHISYSSQHRKEKEFRHFFWRKATRLCQLYSLEQKYTRKIKVEPGQEKYCRIRSIEMNVKWTNPDDDKETKKYRFTLNKDPAKTNGFLPRYTPKYNHNGKDKRQPYKKRQYRMECHDDKLVVKCGTQEISLKKWLGLEKDEDSDE